ncbi:MAG: hypothetical protein OEX12_00135 [Gammaproteobacteria bacterium]|nr:hypothetical protein [Gammaproteobacteria bacterium]
MSDTPVAAVPVQSNVFKKLLGKRITSSHKFMGENVTIQKLSVAEVMSIQESATKAQALADDAKNKQTMGQEVTVDDKEGFNSLKNVIRMGAPESTGLDDEDFNQFPLEELISLSQAIMKFSGIDPSKEGNES